MWCAASTVPAMSSAAVPGYLEEVKVPADNQCRTFVALRTGSQELALGGRAFYLRTGKRLARRDAQIVVNFRDVPHKIFPGTHHPNRLVIISCNPGRPGLPDGPKGTARPSSSRRLAGPGLRQGLCRQPGRRLRAPAAGRHRRPPEPLRPQ